MWDLQSAGYTFHKNTVQIENCLHQSETSSPRSMMLRSLKSPMITPFCEWQSLFHTNPRKIFMIVLPSTVLRKSYCRSRAIHQLLSKISYQNRQLILFWISCKVSWRNDSRGKNGLGKSRSFRCRSAIRSCAAFYATGSPS